MYVYPYIYITVEDRRRPPPKPRFARREAHYAKPLGVNSPPPALKRR
jgi:hypothetical protein